MILLAVKTTKPWVRFGPFVSEFVVGQIGRKTKEET